MSPLCVFAQYSPAPAGVNVFYYSYTCPHCRKVEAFFRQYDVVNKYGVIIKEVSGNPANAKELTDLSTAHGIDINDVSVPVLSFSGQFISGDQPIIDFISAKLGLADAASSTTTTAQIQHKFNLTLPTVIIAALADSLNPCAFSVMIFLMLTLLAIGSRKKMLKIGLVYIVSVYLVYFLAGLGILAALQAFGLVSKWLLYAAAAVSIIAGLINIKDFFWYGKGFTLAIPESKKPVIEKYIKKASIPAAVILGMLVALFELPCTGGFYLAILALLAQKATYDRGLLYLVMYNLFFIVPLLVILFIVYYGASPAKLEQWRTAKRKWLRLLMGVVLVGLGISLIFLF